MNTNEFISNLVISMREFQRKNNIKNNCITNVQYLYDVIRMNRKDINVKTKAVFVFSYDDITKIPILNDGHLVVILNDKTIIDPSYDVFCLRNKMYFDNLKDLMDSITNNDDLKSNFNMDELKANFNVKQSLITHIRFKNISNRINNGELLISDKKFYTEQADYIEQVNFHRRLIE
jgi:hypothetical protein